MSPTGQNNRPAGQPLQAENGFTLIEVMVVIVIVGLMASFVLLSLPPGRKTAQDQAEEFAARLTLASHRAVLAGETVGITLSDEGYGFVHRRAGRWRPFELIPKVPRHTWEEESAIRVELEGEVVKLVRRPRTNNSPVIYFTATGESPPFSVTIRAGGEHATVETNAMGEIGLRGTAEQR